MSPRGGAGLPGNTIFPPLGQCSEDLSQPVPVFGDVDFFFFFSETGFLCVALAVLELTL